MQITLLRCTQQRGSGKSFDGQPVPRLGMDTWPFCVIKEYGERAGLKNTVKSSRAASLSNTRAGVIVKNSTGFPEKGRKNVVWGSYLLGKPQ